MSKLTQRINRFIPGFNGLISFVQNFIQLPWIIKNYLKFNKSAKSTTGRFNFSLKNSIFCVGEDTTNTSFDPHYTYHPAWAARKLAEIRPLKHVDIGSIIEFATVASAFVPIEFYDYRPSDIHLSNYSAGHANLLNLHFRDNSIESLSCLHTIEHIGLGRYGDPIDYDGDIKAIKELVRVLAPNGTLLFVTPVGQPRIQFNAHRIYSYEQIMEYFKDLELQEFTLLPDDSSQGFIENADPSLVMQQKYACGCFMFKKKIYENNLKNYC